MMRFDFSTRFLNTATIHVRLAEVDASMQFLFFSARVR